MEPLMPIVTVQIVVDSESQAPSADQLRTLADRLGEIFGSAKGETWVKAICIEHGHYAENAVVDVSVRPVFVEVLKRHLPEHPLLVAEADRIATATAEVLSRPRANTHVYYLPAGAGRIAFGGQLTNP
jgi:phenylpyruvate tautomerase PptA (4-oxalocrotonate tautomerase family)